jgi:hypothetical protein
MMENHNQPPEKSLFGSLEIDQLGKLNLAEAAKWAKFLGIIGIFFLALLLLVGIAFMFMMPAFMSNMPPSSPFAKMGGAFFGIIYFVIAAINFYPIWAMLKFGSLIRAGIRTENQGTFNEGLIYLKRFFKFIGILTIVVIGIYVLIIVAISIGAAIGGK